MTQRSPASAVPSDSRLLTDTMSSALPVELEMLNHKILEESSKPKDAKAGLHTAGLAWRLVTLTVSSGLITVTVAVALRAQTSARRRTAPLATRQNVQRRVDCLARISCKLAVGYRQSQFALPLQMRIRPFVTQYTPHRIECAHQEVQPWRLDHTHSSLIQCCPSTSQHLRSHLT
jgi:hypothetical protein